jgi:hypothetical protein
MRRPCGHWSPTLFPRDHTHCTTPHSETVLPCVDGDVRRLDCAGLRDRRWRVRTRVNCFRRAVRGVRASPSSHSALDQRLRAGGRQLFSVVLASTLASPGIPLAELRNDAMLVRYFPTATRDGLGATRHVAIVARQVAVVTCGFTVVTRKRFVGTPFFSPVARQAPAIARLPFVVTDDSARDRGHASSRSSVAAI